MAWPSEVNDKLTALGAIISDQLELHDGNWVTRTRPRADVVLFRATTRADRVRIMGDPVRYCEVLYERPVEPEEEYVLASGEQHKTTHRFSVDVYFEYEDADTQAASSYAEWITAMEDRTNGKEGLLHYLRLTHKLLSQGDDPVVEPRVTETGVARVTEGGVSRVTEGGGALGEFIAHLGNPSDVSPMNAILPLSPDGKDRAHVVSFVIDVT